MSAERPVYVVYEECYEHGDVHGVFLDEVSAKKYVDEHPELCIGCNFHIWRYITNRPDLGSKNI